MRPATLLVCLAIIAILTVFTFVWISDTEAAPRTGVLLTDDFESGTGKWTVGAGTWSIITDGSSVYEQSDASGYRYSTAGSSSWSDYSIQARVKNTTVGGNNSMLIARYQDSGNYYLMQIRNDGHIQFKRMVAPGSTVNIGSGVSAAIAPNTWYTATFEVVGTTLRGYLNGTLMITRTDSNLSTGKVGVGTLDSAAEFDDVLVTSLLPDYMLSVTNAGNGSGSVTSNPSGINCGATCSASFDGSTVVTLTAASGGGSTFAGWMGACTGTDPNACVVTMNATRAVTAVFSLPTQPMLIVNKAGAGTGTVTSNPAGIDCGSTCLDDFPQSTVVTLTASAGIFSAFAGWSGAGCSSTGMCVVTMDVPKSVTATFDINAYLLTVTKSGNGTGTVTSNPAANRSEEHTSNSSHT